MDASENSVAKGKKCLPRVNSFSTYIVFKSCPVLLVFGLAVCAAAFDLLFGADSE